MVAGAATILVVALGLALTWSGDASTPGVAVSLTEYAFAPDPVEAPDGRLAISNDGAIDHNLLVPELGKGSRELAPGEAQVLDLSDQPPGTYTVICDLSGHREQGMETTLVLS